MLQCCRFRRVIGQILFALAVAVSPAAGQDAALPPLPDAIAAQFPAIGRLGHEMFRTRQGCTATLIAPDLVLTAAHCVSDTGHSNRVFAAGWSRGDYIAARASKLETRHPAYGLAGTGKPWNDVALVVLDSPLEGVDPIPLGEIAADVPSGTEVALIGYHRKTPHLLSGAFDCPVKRLAPGLLHVDCPVINGNSGAPLLVKTETGEWRVVGVVSSRLGAGAIAVELQAWLKQHVAAHLGR